MRLEGKVAFITGSGTVYMGFTTAQDAYTASKGALTSLTRSMSIVYAKNNIRANIIDPVL